MKIDKAIRLLDSIESIKTARFYEPSKHLIEFKTDSISLLNTPVISTYPIHGITVNFMKELNEAIKPVLEKYIKIYEEEIKKCLDNPDEK